MARANNLTMCSFCGKSHAEVRKLIAGPGVYICDSCITVCKGILDKEFRRENRIPKNGITVPKPADLKRQLDYYVIGQDHVKKALSMAVFNHYKRSLQEAQQPAGFDLTANVEFKKNNVLMIGPIGSGKKQLVKALQKILQIPVLIYDATSFFESMSLDEIFGRMFLQLIKKADFDIQWAEFSIVFIDSIDSIARNTESLGGARTSKEECIQKALANILNCRSHKVSDYNIGQTWKPEYKEINTGNILFICSGTFDGVGKITGNRLTRESSDCSNRDELEEIADRRTDSNDLIAFGLIPELVASLPVITTLNPLTEAELITILTESRDGILEQFRKLPNMDGVTFNITKDALRAMASEVLKQGTGAHALPAIIDRFMMDVMFESAGRDDIDEVTINRAVVEGTRSPIIRKKKLRDS